MNLTLLSAIIGAFALDSTIAFQMMISSPLFTGPLIGWLLGDFWLGFEMGFLFQLLWLGRIPAGAARVPEGNVASMIATALVLLNRHNGFPNTTLTLVFFEGILLSLLGAIITIWYRKINGHILKLALRMVHQARLHVLVFLEAGSMIVFFLMMFVLTFVIINVSQQFLPGLANYFGGLYESKLIVVKPAILGIGLAFVLPLLKQSFNLRKGT